MLEIFGWILLGVITGLVFGSIIGAFVWNMLYVKGRLNSTVFSSANVKTRIDELNNQKDFTAEYLDISINERDDKNQVVATYKARIKNDKFLPKKK